MLQELKSLLKHYNMATDNVECADSRVVVMESYNKSKGNLTGINCKLCNNRGNFMVIEDGYEFFKPCKCMPARDTLARMEKSGLATMFKNYSMSKFTADTPWHKEMLSLAQRFIENPTGWIYIGGSSGSGKTHICTAIVNKLIRNGKDARYVLWREMSLQLKGNVNDSMAYTSIINPLKKTSVLYIDDFFKGSYNCPTVADVRIAYELLNHRYNNKELITIISSEMALENIFDIDEAIGGRIVEMAGANILNIKGGREVNKRLYNRSLQ